ncbi:hypothetical protein Tco_0555562 [Tanacetum coccineum]
MERFCGVTSSSHSFAKENIGAFEKKISIAPSCLVKDSIVGADESYSFVETDLYLLQKFDDNRWFLQRDLRCDVFEALRRVDFSMSLWDSSYRFFLRFKSQTDEKMKPLVKDKEATDMDVHIYRSMIGSLMYLTASRVSSFDVEAYSDSDYAGANLDRKSTTGAALVKGDRQDDLDCDLQLLQMEMFVRENLDNRRMSTRSCRYPQALYQYRRVLVGILEVIAQAVEIKDLKAQIKQLKKKAVKYSKGAPSVQTHTDWDGLDIDLEKTMDYTLAQNEGKTDSKVEEPKTSSKNEELHLSGDTLVIEDKGSAEKGGSTKSTDLKQSTIKPKEGTDKQDEDTDRQVEVLVIMSQNKVKQKEKEKGVELKNVEDIERPRPTLTRSLLTLKPLPKIDPKAKGKGMIEEEDEVHKRNRKQKDGEGLKRYQDEIPEGFDRVLWGDLMIMFNPSDEDEFWNSQQDWNVVSWKLHGSSGVHTLMTEAGLVIHMLVEKKYPLRRKVLLQMLELKLESEEDSTMALELIRFVKKLIAELEPEDSDGNEEDL